MAGDHLAHKLGRDKLPGSLLGRACVIGDDGQVAFSLTDDLVHDTLGRTNRHKAANHKGRAIRNHRNRLFEGDRFHSIPPVLSA